MKINIFLLAMAAVATALLTYLIHEVSSAETDLNVSLGVAIVSILSTLVPLMSFSNDNKRIQVNLKLISAIAFVAVLIENALFSIIGVANSTYIITCGLTLVVYAVCYYNINRVKDV